MTDDHDLRAAQASLNRLLERQKIDDGNLGFGDVRVVKVPVIPWYEIWRDVPTVFPIKTMTREALEKEYGRRT